MIRRRDDRPVVATREMMRRKRRRRALASLGAVTVVVAGTGYMAWQYIDEQEYLLEERCELQVGEEELQLSPDQTANAAVLSAAAVERGLPGRAAAHAISISLQETELTAPETEGDDDGEGEAAGEADAQELFTRSSPNVASAADTSGVPITVAGFYDSLQDALPDDGGAGGDGGDSADDGDEAPSHWHSELGAAEAAEVLERPHDVSFYEQYDQLGRAFAAPLTGQQPVGMSCHLSQREVPGPDPQGVAEELAATLPQVLQLPAPEESEASDNDSDGGDDTAEPYYSEVIDVTGDDEEAAVVVEVPEPESDQAESAGEGPGSDHVWLIAHWAVAHAEHFGVQNVHAGHYVWDRDTAGWERTEEAREHTVALTFSR